MCFLPIVFPTCLPFPAWRLIASSCARISPAPCSQVVAVVAAQRYNSELEELLSQKDHVILEHIRELAATRAVGKGVGGGVTAVDVSAGRLHKDGLFPMGPAARISEDLLPEVRRRPSYHPVPLPRFGKPVSMCSATFITCT